jgi:peptide/nickel transport system substrate-binding protein
VLYSAAGGESLRRRADWWCKAEMAITAETISLFAANSTAQIRDQFEFADLSLACADPGSDRYVDYRCDYELWSSESGNFLYLACSIDSRVLRGELRTALTYAIDREALASDTYRGFAQVATLPASPKFPYYSQALAKRYAYDPERFAQAVADAGMTDAHVVLLVNADDSLRVRAAEAIALMLEEGGLDVSISRKKGNDYQNAVRMRQYDLYLGQTRLSPNMDLSPFFSTWGDLSYGGVNNASAYALCLKALDNYGNYYTLHSNVMENGLLCPVLFQNYAIFTTRGELTGLTPARDNIFYYSLGKTMADARITE